MKSSGHHKTVLGELVSLLLALQDKWEIMSSLPVSSEDQQ